MNSPPDRPGAGSARCSRGAGGETQHYCLDERICSDDGRAPSYPCFLSLKTRCLAKTLPYANAAYPPISAVSTAGHFSRQTC